MNIKYVHGQVITFSLRALYRFGKAMKTEDKEEADNHLDVMKRHIEFVQECIELPAFSEDE